MATASLIYTTLTGFVPYDLDEEYGTADLSSVSVGELDDVANLSDHGITILKMLLQASMDPNPSLRPTSRELVGALTVIFPNEVVTLFGQNND